MNLTKKSSSILERQNSVPKKSDEKKPKNEENNLNASLVVVPMGGNKQAENKDTEIIAVRRLKECDYYQNTEWREMAEGISR